MAEEPSHLRVSKVIWLHTCSGVLDKDAAKGGADAVNVAVEDKTGALVLAAHERLSIVAARLPKQATVASRPQRHTPDEHGGKDEDAHRKKVKVKVFKFTPIL